MELGVEKELVPVSEIRFEGGFRNLLAVTQFGGIVGVLCLERRDHNRVVWIVVGCFGFGLDPWRVKECIEIVS